MAPTSSSPSHEAQDSGGSFLQGHSHKTSTSHGRSRRTSGSRTSGHRASRHIHPREDVVMHQGTKHTVLVGRDSAIDPSMTEATLISPETQEEGLNATHHVLRRRKQPHLKNEVEHLRSQNVELSERLAAADSTSYRLEGELKQLQQRYSELERLAQDGTLTGEIVVAVSENDHLRKQLSAYSTEIDSLRDEKTNLLRNLEDSQMALQHMTAERDKLLNSSAKVLLDLETSGSDLRQQTANLSAQAANKDRQYQEVLSMLQPVHEKLMDLQQAYVHQTKEFRMFVNVTRRQQRELERCLESAKYEMSCHHDKSLTLNESLADLRGESTRIHSAALQRLHDQEQRHLEQLHGKINLQLHRPPTSEKRSILLGCLDRNIAKEMAMAMAYDTKQERRRPIELKKVHERHHVKEPREVVLCPNEMLLRWSKPQSSTTYLSDMRRESCLDLYEVIRIDYGSMARASVIHKSITDEPPWHCFSLYTIRCPYDFICPSEEIARCFVLSISRMCYWAAGAMPSRHAFELAKAWCKLQERSYRERKTLRRLFLDAAYATAPADRHISPAASAAEERSNHTENSSRSRLEERNSPADVISSRTRASGNQFSQP